MLDTVVKPEFGPTLPQLLRGRSRVLQGLVAAAFVIPVLVAGWILTGGARRDETFVVVREPIAFNLAYGPRLKPVADPTSALRLEQRLDGRFVQSFVVRPFTLPAYRGAPAGALPLAMGRYADALPRQFEGLEVVREGRTRVNENPGYEIVFRAKLNGETLYGRRILLVPALDEDANLILDTVRDGVVLELAATRASGTPNALGTGTVGALKKPLRSFRFGTERSGGAAKP